MTELIMNAQEFDYLFDNGMDSVPFSDWFTAVNARGEEIGKRIECAEWNGPRGLIQALAIEADSRGVSFDELLTTWLGDRVREERNREAQTMVAIALEDPDRMKQWIDERVREVRDSEEAAFARARETMTPQDVAPLLPANEPDLQRA